ncbi:hypothetical protein HPB50_028981 [Hyalomma asiaticum]|nr:hypothetical protein HPB50_028981 [Hyalomma asiaticum]
MGDGGEKTLTPCQKKRTHPDRKRGNSLPLRGESLPTEDCRWGRKLAVRGRISSGLGRILRDFPEAGIARTGKSAASEKNAGQASAHLRVCFGSAAAGSRVCACCYSEYSLRSARVSGSDAVRPRVSSCPLSARPAVRACTLARGADGGDTHEAVRSARGPRETFLEARAREGISPAAGEAAQPSPARERALRVCQSSGVPS